MQTAGEKVNIEIRKDEQIVGKLLEEAFKGQSRLRGEGVRRGLR